MIPILFEPKTKDFNSNGLGRLMDAVSCLVTEERNGEYELELKYPIDGILSQDIEMASIILAEPGEGKKPQPFDVYKVSKPMNGIVTINAEHISYQLSYIPCAPFTAQTAAGALAGFEQHAAEECPYTFWTDKTSSGSFAVSVPASIRSKLGGVEGSILDVYGGEYEFDRYTVKLWENRGADNGVVLRYGKNITDLTQEENISNTITGIYPYWADSDGNLMELPEKIISSDKAENFPYPRTVPLDLSSEFQERPTADELRTAAESYIKSNNIGVPSVSINVSFVPLWQTEEYKDLALIESVKLCDIITVDFEKLGVKAKAKIVRTVYDVLKGRYQSLEVGDVRATLASTIAEQNRQIEDKPSKGFLDDAVRNATNWITGVNGGCVVFHKNANGQPYEILIMDTDSIDTAKNVWRWNQNGWGHSSSGYNGHYTMAATIDGGIVADYITAGTMMADRIKGGTLTLGGTQNGDGICLVLDSAGTECVRMDSLSGINIKKGSINLGGNFIATLAGHITAKQGVLGPWRFWDKNFMTEDYLLQFVQQSDGTWNIMDTTGTAVFKNLTLYGNANISGSLQVTGTKNRIVETKYHGKRLLNAYETAEAYFGDIGFGQILDDGLCFVEIDPVFAETVTLDQYVVFLQAEGPGELYIDEKKQDSFTVKGTPGLEFAYEIKAKQKGYEKMRLEKKE